MVAASTPAGFWARAYGRWMSFAEVSRRAVAAIIFGTVYLTAGLVFAIARRAFSRRQSGGTTFWRTRAQRTPTADFFRRMS